MNKNVLGIMLYLVLVAVFSNSAMADPAVVIKDGGCVMFDGNGGFVSTTNSQTVAAQSENDNATLTCKADVAPSVDGRAVRYSSDDSATVCVIGGGPLGWFTATSYHETVSAGGKATLTCRYNANKV